MQLASNAIYRGDYRDANFEVNSKIFYQKVLLMYNYTMMLHKLII